MSVSLTSMMVSVLGLQRPLTSRSPRSSEGRGVGGDDGFEELGDDGVDGVDEGLF